MNCNLSELPWSVVQKLSAYLNVDNDWEKLLNQTDLISNGSETLASWRKLQNPTERLLNEMGNRCRTVGDLLCLLDKAKLEKPQLVLRRKFQAVKIVDQTSSSVVVERGSVIRISCKAVGFPYPNYQWFCDGVIVESANYSVLQLSSDEAQPTSIFHCSVWNCVEACKEWSNFYCKADKTFRSDLNSEPITLTVVQPLRDSMKCNSTCDNCAAAQRVIDKIRDAIDDDHELSPACSCLDSCATANDDIDDDACFATDKVALIVSNSEYWHLPSLLTPPCDAQALAEALLMCGFKTVTLADLTLFEMRVIIAEYCRLLGAGVYALFYFAGHGFELNGQCYLLPVDAPNEHYTCDDCLCVEQILSMMQETSPWLNVILLDVCRKLPATNTLNLARNKIYKPRVNRNTVFGYATSFGEGAFEVRGETNGIFMKYLKTYIDSKKPVTEILNLVIRDLENDPKATDAQFPEIRSNLSRPRSLADPMDPAGHTQTFDHRTLQWQDIHELPDPIKVKFEELNLLVTIWFDFCGHFTNMVYVFTSVSSFCKGDEEMETIQDDFAKEHLAYLKFPKIVEAVKPTVCDDTEEGVSVRTLVKHLQRVKGSLTCTIDLENHTTSKTVAHEDVILGKVLVAKLEQWQQDEPPLPTL